MDLAGDRNQHEQTTASIRSRHPAVGAGTAELCRRVETAGNPDDAGEYGHSHAESGGQQRAGGRR